MFDNFKDEILDLIRCRKQDLMRMLAKARITVTDHRLMFNREPTRLLGGYFNTGLQFKAHKKLLIEKV